MSYEITAIIILVGSLFGIGVILLRKIPVLVELPETPAGFNLKESLLKLKNKIKFLKHLKIPAYEIFLQKILSKVRVLTLKTESKTSNWLEKLRQKSIKKRNNFSDNYWQGLKKSTNQKIKKKNK